MSGLWSSYYMHLAVSGITSEYNHTQNFSAEMGVSQFFLSRMAWNHDRPGVSLLHSLRWQVYTNWHPALGWDNVSRTFCPGWPQTMVLWISTSEVARITGMHPARSILGACWVSLSLPPSLPPSPTPSPPYQRQHKITSTFYYPGIPNLKHKSEWHTLWIPRDPGKYSNHFPW
jgi:hypothetical protein